MAVTKKIVLQYCVGCHREINADKFNSSKIDYHTSGYLPYCKDCCAKIYEKNCTKMKSREGAMFMTCATMNVPFIRRVWDAFTADYDSRNLKYSFGAYYNRLANNKVFDPQGFYQTDVDFNDIAGVSKNEQMIQNDMQELKLYWGRDKTVEQIQFLEFTYDRYVGDEILTDSQDSTYRDLCRAELTIYENGDVESARKTKRECFKDLGLDNIKANKQETLVERMLEKRIFEQENEEPAYYYKDLEKYADFMGIGNYWKNHILRPIKNLLLGSKEYKVIKDDEQKKE